MTKVSTNELTSSVILMTACAHIAGKVADTAKRNSDHLSPDDKVYEVRITINDIKVDWNEFEREMIKQFEDAVIAESRSMLGEELLARVEAAIHETEDSIRSLPDRVLAATQAGFFINKTEVTSGK